MSTCASTPWPAPLPHGASDPVTRQSFNDTFGAMRTSMESYRSSAPAAVGDVLTVPPYALHQVMGGEWLSWINGEPTSEEHEVGLHTLHAVDPQNM
jgi:hypothetical protein